MAGKGLVNAYKVFINKPRGKKPISRSHQQWMDRVNKDLESLGITRIEETDDRKLRRNLAKAAKDLHSW